MDILEKNPFVVIILYLRTSSRSKFPEEKLKRQETVLLNFLSELTFQGTILKIFKDTGPGWFKSGSNERGNLRKIINIAKTYEKGYGVGNVIILSESTDRLLRNENYSGKKDIELLPTEEEFQKLIKLARGIPLVTMLHPDTCPREVRRHQIKTSNKIKGTRQERREISKQKAVEMIKKGFTLKEISEKLKVTTRTISNWKTIR